MGLHTMIGKEQREILEVLADGGTLEDEGNMWRMCLDGYSGRCASASSKRLYKRGMVRLLSREEHPGYSGGYRAIYVITDVGLREVSKISAGA
jgi:hypothetical protein